MGQHMTVEGNTENIDLFQDRSDLEARIERLKASIPNRLDKQQAFEMIGIDPSRFSRLSRKQVMEVVYGDSQPHPQNSKDLESIEEKLKSREIYGLYGVAIDDGVGLLPSIGIQTLSTGFRQEINLVFEHGYLVDVIPSHKPINTTNDITIFSVPEHVLKHPPVGAMIP